MLILGTTLKTTLLHLAESPDSQAVAEYLSKKGADTEARNNAGNLPTMPAKNSYERHLRRGGAQKTSANVGFVAHLQSVHDKKKV